MVHEANKGAEIISHRPDGTKAELLSGIILRIRRKAQEQLKNTKTDKQE